MTVKSIGLPTCSVSNSVTPGITGSTTRAEDKSCVSTSVMQEKTDKLMTEQGGLCTES